MRQQGRVGRIRCRFERPHISQKCINRRTLSFFEPVYRLWSLNTTNHTYSGMPTSSISYRRAALWVGGKVSQEHEPDVRGLHAGALPVEDVVLWVGGWVDRLKY